MPKVKMNGKMKKFPYSKKGMMMAEKAKKSMKKVAKKVTKKK